MPDSSDFNGNMQHLKQQPCDAIPVISVASTTVAKVAALSGPKLTLSPFTKPGKEGVTRAF